MGKYPVEGLRVWVKDEDQIDTIETCREIVGHGDQPRFEIWCRFDVRLICYFVFSPPLKSNSDKLTCDSLDRHVLRERCSWPPMIFRPSVTNLLKSG